MKKRERGEGEKEREGERERGRGRERQREKKGGREREGESERERAGYPSSSPSYNDASRVRGCRATANGRRSDVLESYGERPKQIITKRTANPESRNTDS